MSDPAEGEGSERYAFVLSQIGAGGSPERHRADQVLKYVIEPAANAHNLRVVRSDKDLEPGQITAQIVRHIVSATVIVADLTGKNPNVGTLLPASDRTAG